MDKKALRQSIIAQRRAMTAEQITESSKRLAEKLFKTEYYQNAQSIYGYMSITQEVRTGDILKRAHMDGKRIAVPKILGDEMEFIWLEDLDLTAPGYFNIPEPISSGPFADDEFALILMPGLAFDREGHRIGYGGGFYDRYLTAHPYHKLVALCYNFQLLDHLETESHDVPVDLVIVDD